MWMSKNFLAKTKEPIHSIEKDNKLDKKSLRDTSHKYDKVHCALYIRCVAF